MVVPVQEAPLVADLWADMFLEVWKRWCKHTEGNEDVRNSGVMWDITSPSKITEVGESETAAHVRKYHHWFSVQGRLVIMTVNTGAKSHYRSP